MTTRDPLVAWFVAEQPEGMWPDDMPDDMIRETLGFALWDTYRKIQELATETGDTELVAEAEAKYEATTAKLAAARDDAIRRYFDS